MLTSPDAKTPKLLMDLEDRQGVKPGKGVRAEDVQGPGQ